MSNFDFYTGYWQKEVEKESKAKTVVIEDLFECIQSASKSPYTTRLIHTTFLKQIRPAILKLKLAQCAFTEKLANWK